MYPSPPKARTAGTPVSIALLVFSKAAPCDEERPEETRALLMDRDGCFLQGTAEVLPSIGTAVGLSSTSGGGSYNWCKARERRLRVRFAKGLAIGADR